MARKTGLRGTKSQHKSVAEGHMYEARKHLASATKAIKEGSCTIAYMKIADMWHALGRADANGRWAGGTPWEPTSEIQELGYQFSTYCLRDTPVVLDGATRSRRRSKR